MPAQLACLLPLPILSETRTEQHRPAVVLPFSRPKAAKPARDWYEKYPCTRMHGAAFETEFYPISDDSF